MPIRIARTGTWLYDGKVPMPVDVVGLEYDFWHEMYRADGLLEPGDVPLSPGPDGLIYYARFKHAGQLHEPTWVDSDGHATTGLAMKAVEGKVEGGIRWEEPEG